MLGAGFLSARVTVDLTDDARLTAVLVQQPANYVAPAIDLIDRHDAFVARVDLPGVSGADLEIVLKERELRISGSKPPAEPTAARQRCHRVEASGALRRRAARARRALLPRRQ